MIWQPISNRYMSRQRATSSRLVGLAQASIAALVTRSEQGCSAWFGGLFHFCVAVTPNTFRQRGHENTFMFEKPPRWLRCTINVSVSCSQNGQIGFGLSSEPTCGSSVFFAFANGHIACS